MSIIISNSSTDPIYVQIEQQIRAQIVDATLQPGQPLPSIRALARELQVSVITTKRAYEELHRNGFIDSVGGKGTFVAHQNHELLREMRMRAVEEKLTEAIVAARELGLRREEVITMVEILMDGGDT